jgi:toxin ParE1/3/4
MELTVYWTQFAEQKLEDIFYYYSWKVGINIAQKLINGLIDKSIELEKNPFIGQKEILLENRPREFRYLVYMNYKIIYLVNLVKKRIEVVNVFDCRQNPVNINEI